MTGQRPIQNIGKEGDQAGDQESMRKSSRGLGMVGMAGVLGMILGVVGVLAQTPSPVPNAIPAGDQPLVKLAAQYQQAQAMAKQEAAQRDQLVLQAQSAIIRMKDAELQMERALAAGHQECGRQGKILAMDGEGWACEPSKGKETPRK